MNRSFLAGWYSVSEASPSVVRNLASFSSRGRLRAGVVMGCESIIRVLLVGEKPEESLDFLRLFERNGCQCHFAKSEQEVAELLVASEFDIVLSTRRISGGNLHRLVALLLGSRASLFHSLRVEEGYWWLPVLRLGKECLGTSAVRGGDFSRVLEQLLMQIRADGAAPLH
jgi:hypothetical protein